MSVGLVVQPNPLLSLGHLVAMNSVVRSVYL